VKVKLLNFSHPLTEENLKETAALLGCEVADIEVADVPSRVELHMPLEPQVASMLNSLGMDPREWQTLPLVVHLPSLSASAAVLLAQMHGLCGRFPSVLRFAPENSGPLTRYAVAEVINLQAVREGARAVR